MHRKVCQFSLFVEHLRGIFAFNIKQSMIFCKVYTAKQYF